MTLLIFPSSYVFEVDGFIFENNTLVFLSFVKTVTKLSQYSRKMCLAQVFLWTISLLKTRYCLRRANGLVGLLRQSVYSSSSCGVKSTNPFILILVLTHRQVRICFTVSLKLVFKKKNLIYYMKPRISSHFFICILEKYIDFKCWF